MSSIPAARACDSSKREPAFRPETADQFEAHALFTRNSDQSAADQQPAHDRVEEVSQQLIEIQRRVE
jgi:hypothetical protein